MKNKVKLIFVFFVLIFSLVFMISSVSSQTSCLIIDATQPCTTSDGYSGIQTCTSSNVWGECVTIDITGAISTRSGGTSYVRANDQLVARVDDSGDLKYYQLDHMKNVQTIINLDGSYDSIQLFTPFGERINLPPYGDPNLNYRSKVLDKLTGLYTIYSPEISRTFVPRFLAKTFLPQSLNPYSYMANNPFREVKEKKLYPYLVLSEAPSSLISKTSTALDSPIYIRKDIPFKTTPTRISTFFASIKPEKEPVIIQATLLKVKPPTVDITSEIVEIAGDVPVVYIPEPDVFKVLKPLPDPPASTRKIKTVVVQDERNFVEFPATVTAETTGQFIDTPYGYDNPYSDPYVQKSFEKLIWDLWNLDLNPSPEEIEAPRTLAGHHPQNR